MVLCVCVCMCCVCETMCVCVLVRWRWRTVLLYLLRVLRVELVYLSKESRFHSRRGLFSLLTNGNQSLGLATGREKVPRSPCIGDHRNYKSTGSVVHRTICIRVIFMRNHRMTQQRQYRCRDAPALGGGVTGAKYAWTLMFGKCAWNRTNHMVF